MPEAFLLISCDVGKEDGVIEELSNMDDVKEVQKPWAIRRCSKDCTFLI